MIKKKTLFLLVFILIFCSGCNFSKKNERFEIPKKYLNSLSFITTTKDNGIIFTSNNKSYQLHKDKKKELDFEIIDNFQSLNKNLFVVKKGKKVGIVDETFNLVLAFNYDSITNLGNNYIIGQEGRYKFLINIKTYDLKGPFSNILAFENGKIFKVEMVGESKYLNDKGQEIPELNNKNIFFFRDGVAITEKNNKFGLYDIINLRYIPEENQEIYFSEKNILIKKFDKYFLNGKEIQIKKFYPTMNDVLIYDFKEGFGLFNLKDNIFYKESYSEVAPNFDKFLIVGKNNKYNVMNKYKEKKVEFPYDYIIKIGKNSFAAGTDSIGLFALIVNGKKVTEEKYQNFLEINSSYFIGTTNDSYTILDKEGNIIIECSKDKLIYHNTDVIIVEINDKVYVYSLKEEE